MLATAVVLASLVCTGHGARSGNAEKNSTEGVDGFNGMNESTHFATINAIGQASGVASSHVPFACKQNAIDLCKQECWKGICDTLLPSIEDEAYTDDGEFFSSERYGSFKVVCPGEPSHKGGCRCKIESPIDAGSICKTVTQEELKNLEKKIDQMQKDLEQCKSALR
mmetsp:Transcript_138375/g.239096  ORF Transcript_138375/g.239096 Transcript_138375/m.239096 type:complete len:167 (+) Transcript_138375:66-566(+)